MDFAFGIFDSFDLGDSTPGQVIADRLDFAVAAEAAGIAHYHVTEHHGTPLSVCPSPNLFLAALSQRTSTLRIGALVHVLPTYDPLRLAEELATLDQLTHGRLDVGVGAGVSPYELAFFGIEQDQARALYAETLEVVTKALTNGRISHRGRLLRDYDVELSVGPVQHPHPPLWYASSNTNTAQWAGANNVNFVGRWNGGTFQETTETYWHAWHAREEPSATPPRIGVAANVLIGATDDEAQARYRKANDVFARQLTKLWHEHDDHRVDVYADTEGALRNGTALVGSAETVRDLLVEQVRQAPVNYFEATLAFGDLTPEESQANLDAFAETVMPAVREAAARRGETFVPERA
ncbi:LLM class flavin-dependent oxidoreductase [Streptomyces sp. NPDC048251]|uniref:LLM class flavin-dependent oxidoreductase n=1 Tax=Streptomyces sp. NPDC048251 TaxID=3154501 RepID=UPI0034357754